MANALGFYILWRAWRHMLRAHDYEAMDVLESLKQEIIHDESSNQPQLMLVIAIDGWADDSEIRNFVKVPND